MITTRTWLAGIAVAGVAAVAAALVSQHLYGMQPCPWCVLQRLIFLAISAAAAVAWLLHGRARLVALVLLVLLTGCGAASALWQHFVASSAASCNLTLADRIIGGMQLDAHWPEVFMATASCAEAQVDLLGLPYEAWSLALFALMGAVAVRLLLPRRAPGGAA